MTLWHLLRKLYRPYRWQVVLFVFCSGIVGVRGLASAYLTKVLIDDLEKQVPLASLIWIAALFIANFEIYNLCWRIIDYLTLRIFPIVKNRAFQLVFERVLASSYALMQNQLDGSVVKRIDQVAEGVDQISSKLTVHLVRGGAQLIVALISMACVHPLFSWVLLIWALGFTVVSWRYAPHIRALSDEQAKCQSLVSGRLVDSITNFSAVKLFSRTRREKGYLQGALTQMKRTMRERSWFLLKFYFFQGLSITCLMGTLLYILLRLRLRDQVTTGDFAFVLAAAVYVTENVWRLTERLDELNSVWGSCSHGLNVVFTPPDVDDLTDGPSIPIHKGGIKFEYVGFSYPNRLPLFDHLNIEILAGQRVGIAGPSGSGKSSFVGLILRLYDVQKGRVTIDGHDVRSFKQDDLRSQISVVPQEPLLFHRSIMENIRYGRPSASDAEVIAAAKEAHLHHLLGSLEEVIGKQGAKLSGGERQRIAIARACLKNAPILILDEATSQLDTIQEEIIQNALGRLMQGRTTLVIAHRLSTLVQMDRILIFDGGDVVADGSHDKLFSQQGIYNEMWEALKA